MQTCKDYKFEVSLSDERLIDKTISDAMIGSTSDYQNRLTRKEYGFKANRGISFRRTEVTCSELHSAIEEGASFCSLFDTTQEVLRFSKGKQYTIKPRKDGSFSSSFKCNETFLGSYFLGVDIDKTGFKNVEEYVSYLSLKPTIYYTTYSNLQPEKGARFRLIYVLDQMIDNIYLFRYMANNLNKIIEEDTCEFIYDNCNLKSTQYFNGTCKMNQEIIYSSHNSNLIYSFSDMSYSKNVFISYLTNYCDYRTYDSEHVYNISTLLFNLTNKEYIYKDKKFYVNEEVRDISENPINELNGLFTNPLSSINPEMEKQPHPEMDIVFRDWDRLDEESFMKSRAWNKLRNETKYIFRVEKEEWINGIYQFVEDDYFRLVYITKTKHDGDKRRRTLFQRMCFRKIINPTITYEELVVGTIIDILRFFDRDMKHGNVLSSDFIKRNVETCLTLSIEEIRNLYKNSINWLMRNTRPKRGIIYLNKRCHSKTNTFFILDDLYQRELSVKRNMDNLNNNLKYKIRKSLIYEYLSDRDIKPIVEGRMSDEEAYELIDINLSIRKNMEFFKEYCKEKGLTLGEERMKKLKKLKEKQITLSSINPKTEKETQLSENYDDKTSNNTLSSINPEMEKQPHPDYETKYDNEFELLEFDEILNEETEGALYGFDRDFLGNEPKQILETDEYGNQHENQDESDMPAVSNINDEFDRFQEDLCVREKRLKTFVRFEIDDDLFNVIEELSGISYS